MKNVFILLVWLPLLVLSKVPARCFNSTTSAQGSTVGDAFSDLNNASFDQLTLDARISRVIVCMNQKGGRIDGMQIQLTNPVNGTN